MEEVREPVHVNEESDDNVPVRGLLFESERVLREFYLRYAHKKGFGVTKLSGKKGDDGKQKYFSLACSCQGKYVSSSDNGFNARPSCKTGCRARINVIVDSHGKCKISKVFDEHNHILSPTKARYHRSHKRLDPRAKKVLDFNDRAGIRLYKSFSALAIEEGGYDQMTYEESNCRTWIRKCRESRLGVGDAEAVCSYFERMRQRNPGFFHCVQLDDDGRLHNLFWADARPRAAYESFCDVVTFDTTYLTNMYLMPFDHLLV